MSIFQKIFQKDVTNQVQTAMDAQVPTQPVQQPPVMAQSDVPVDKEAQAHARAELVLERTFARVAGVFTKEDMQTFASLESADTTGDAVKFFVLSKVPQFEAILQEEIAAVTAEKTQTRG